MSPRTARIVARSLVALGLLIVAATVILGLTTLARQRPGQIVVVPRARTADVRRAAARLDPERDCPGLARADPSLGDAPSVYCRLVAHRADGSTFRAGWNDIVFLLLGAVWLGTGAIIVSRQPRNAAGWFFAAIGLFFQLGGLAEILVVKGVKVDPGSVPLLGSWAVIAEYSIMPFTLVSLLFLLYPDGRPPTPRWRWAEWALLFGVGIAVVSFALDPGPLNNLVDLGIVYLNPTGIPALAGTAGGIVAFGAVIALAASLSTVVAVRGRFKRSTGEERQQMRWLVFVATIAAILFAVMFAATALADALLGPEVDRVHFLGINPFDLLWIGFAMVLVLGIPAAYLIAIFKHGLWDLDLVIKKALVAFVLTVLLVGLGLVLIGMLGTPALWVGNRRLAVAIGVIAGLLLWPLLRLSRRLARRLVFGRRADPYAVLTEFSEHVGETYSTEDVLPRMARLLAEGTGATSARVLMRIGSELDEGARWPADAPAERDAFVVPVVDRGEELGALAVAMPANDPMNPAKEKLVRDLASQAGLVLRNARLVEELRASRRRIVSAQDERARKLERDIHDGAQQQLVALGVKMRLLEPMLERDPATARELLGQLQTDTSDAIDNLRDLARGIYPPILADRGLVAAVDAQGRKAAVPVHLEPDGVGRYPQEVESAVYFCVLEALQNAGKYAHAKDVTVRLREQNGTLVFEIRDDGVGFDPVAARDGTGLRGMADRLEAVGGELALSSAPGHGTTIGGRVPVGRDT